MNNSTCCGQFHLDCLVTLHCFSAFIRKFLSIVLLRVCTKNLGSKKLPVGSYHYPLWLPSRVTIIFWPNIWTDQVENMDYYWKVKMGQNKYASSYHLTLYKCIVETNIERAINTLWIIFRVHPMQANRPWMRIRSFMKLN